MVYSHGILEEDYNMSAAFFDKDLGIDSTILKSFRSEKSRLTYKENIGLDGKSLGFTPVEKLIISQELSEADKTLFAAGFKELASREPIHNRLERQEVYFQLEQEFKIREWT